MAYRINTNIAAMNAQVSSNANSRELGNSLSRLSSGLRINTAADDASGMTIADSLRSQHTTLGQAIKNANDAGGIITIADKAMDEQLKILNTIKTKAAQAAADGQSTDSRNAIQNDITKLMEELDNIANTTSYNGIQLLSGAFNNKQFQIGGYSRETISVNIGDTTSAKIGSVRFETTTTFSASIAATSNIAIKNLNGSMTTIAGVTVSTSAGTGLGALAEAINKYSDITGVRARAIVQSTASASVAAGNISSLVVNSVTIGAVSSILANDSDGKLVNAINAVQAQTGVQASIDNQGRLNLTSLDGRGIVTQGLSAGLGGMSDLNQQNFGRLTYSRLGAGDIVISGGAAIPNFSAAGAAAYTMNLRSINGSMSAGMLAGGAYANTAQSASVTPAAGVTTRSGAMMVMDIAESAIQQLDKIRAGLGSTKNQLDATINNISVTQVNVASAESQIRDVDFAEESANFSKRNILAQSGSYAMSQANQIQQNVMRLLQ